MTSEGMNMDEQDRQDLEFAAMTNVVAGHSWEGVFLSLLPRGEG